MNNIDTKRKTDESYEDYCDRMYTMRKALGYTNDVMGYIINENVEDKDKKDESAHRKPARIRIKSFNKGYQQALEEIETDDNQSDSLEAQGMDTLKPKSHLNKMSEMLGEYTIRKRDMQLERNSLASLVREATPGILMTEKYEEILNSGALRLPRFNPLVLENMKDNKNGHLKVITSDMHIGMIIDEEYNTYNYDITRKRLEYFANKAISKAKHYGVTNISLIDLGDIVESILLRGNQAWDCEFNESEQIAHAQEAYEDFIEIFTEAGYSVNVSFIRGNHDRMQGQKLEAIDSDSATYIIAENLKRLYAKLEKKLGHSCGVTFSNTNKYYTEHHEIINGKNIKYIHGDNTSYSDKGKLSKYSGTDESNYDYIFLGHLHRFSSFQHNRNEMEIYCPSVMGGNEYGMHKIKSTSSAGAVLALFLENGEIIIDNVDLNDIN